MDQAHDELFAGTTLAVDQGRRIERGHARRELEDVLHGGAPCDKVLRGRVAGNALAQ